MNAKRIAFIIGALLGIFVAARLLLSQGRVIDSAPFKGPPPPPMVGPLAPNDNLKVGRYIFDGAVPGPEDIAFDDKGCLYTGGTDGKIYRVDIKATPPKVEVFADPGESFSLGLRFDRNDNLIVCNDPLGLLSIAPNGKIEVLTNSFEGKPIKFLNNLDIASDGKIYFSESSTKNNGPNVKLESRYEMLEGRPQGRLLSYDPATKKTSLVADGMYFPNGVAMSPDDEFVLVNETSRDRISRVWLKGEKKGTTDYFAENLPGIPDNLKSVGDGTYWEAFFVPRMKLVEALKEQTFAKNFIALLPAMLLPKPDKYGLVAHFDATGKIIESLHDPGGTLYCVTTAVPYKKHLYLGTVEGRSVFEHPL
jgi:sugar lactone lactonase YvrE